MISDEDELHTKVVVLYEIYNFIFQTFLTEIVWISKYVSQNFIELISKESICSKVTSECIMVEKDLKWKNNQNKSCRSRKFIQLGSSQFFLFKVAFMPKYLFHKIYRS